MQFASPLRSKFRGTGDSFQVIRLIHATDNFRTPKLDWHLPVYDISFKVALMGLQKSKHKSLTMK